jgi:hypothetical protein
MMEKNAGVHLIMSLISLAQLIMAVISVAINYCSYCQHSYLITCLICDLCELILMPTLSILYTLYMIVGMCTHPETSVASVYVMEKKRFYAFSCEGSVYAAEQACTA